MPVRANVPIPPIRQRPAEIRLPGDALGYGKKKLGQLRAKFIVLGFLRGQSRIVVLAQQGFLDNEMLIGRGTQIIEDFVKPFTVALALVRQTNGCLIEKAQ